jgi:hypothetical protein
MSDSLIPYQAFRLLSHGQDPSHKLERAFFPFSITLPIDFLRQEAAKDAATKEAAAKEATKQAAEKEAAAKAAAKEAASKEAASKEAAAKEATKAATSDLIRWPGIFGGFHQQKMEVEWFNDGLMCFEMVL